MGHYNIDDVETAKEAAHGDMKARWLLFEKRMSKALDEIADNMGIRPAPWYKWYLFFLTVWFLLMMISNFIRPDYLDLTCCSVLIYCHIMKSVLVKHAYRAACIGTLLSLPFDLVYLIIFSEFYWHKAMGYDPELHWRRTVLVINYIKFIWKLLFWFLLWKITIDFEETVRYKTSKHYYDQ